MRIAKLGLKSSEQAGLDVVSVLPALKQLRHGDHRLAANQDYIPCLKRRGLSPSKYSLRAMTFALKF